LKEIIRLEWQEKNSSETAKR